jgi:hypothetical protein
VTMPTGPKGQKRPADSAPPRKSGGLFGERRAALNRLKASGRFLAAPTIFLEFEADLLAIVEAAHAGTFHGRDVDENILAAAVWLDEAEALLGIEPLNRARSHFVIDSYKVVKIAPHYRTRSRAANNCAHTQSIRPAFLASRSCGPRACRSSDRGAADPAGTSGNRRGPGRRRGFWERGRGPHSR